jgi:multidrug resistance efflux pump
VASLAVDVGETVVEQAEIARVRGTTGIEVLTAPIRGTVTGIPVHVGDTVLPGAGIATVADLSRLQVETTDVDEFLIARVRPGQRVTLIIDALERRLGGQVRTVGLEPAAVAGSDDNYPVTIDLLDSLPELRAGMTARILFPD